MDEITVPIYLITGFLESGKTSLSVLPSSRIISVQRERHFSFSCEEGEEEYDEKNCSKHNAVLEEIVEGPEQFTLDYLKKLNKSSAGAYYSGIQWTVACKKTGRNETPAQAGALYRRL